MMALHRLYVDEVGNHDMTHADDPNQRFLSLTGVILESEHTLRMLRPEMDDIKREFFQRDPDEPVIFHRKEMVNKRPPFHALRNPETEQRFNTTLLTALARWQYWVITIVIDKKAHRDHYQVWHYHPYHYCLAVLLERFLLFLHYGDLRGDVMVESRGGREDRKLKESYTRLYERGTDNIPPERWRSRLTSRELKVKPKSADIAGLQLADLIAHPSRREVLIEHQLIVDDRRTFGDQICAILRQSRANTIETGKQGRSKDTARNYCPKKRSAHTGALPMAYGHPPPLNGLLILYHRSGPKVNAFCVVFLGNFVVVSKVSKVYFTAATQPVLAE